MPDLLRTHTAFVPHDLTRPIAGAPTGPLFGLSAAVKDMYDIVGQRTGGGSPEWLANNSEATTNADVVMKILDAGATIAGKTVCDEYFYSVTGVNAHYGTPVNPRAPGRLPGGSSSGSASAVAAGICDFAIGSDTGGSVRIPATFCGVYGIRPTHGRVNLSGAMAMAPTFDVPGWFSSGPGVFRKVGDVLLDDRRDLAKIERLVALDDAFAQADLKVAALLRAALQVMSGDLPKAENRSFSPKSLDKWRELFRTIQGREVWETFGNFVDKYNPQMGPGIRDRMDFAAKVSREDADAARRVMAEERAYLRSLVPRGTILALPTAPCIAPLMEMPESDLEPFRLRVMRLTCIAGVSGLPQITLPVGTISSCPVGLSFIAWEGGDESLLELSLTLSRHFGLAA